MNRRRQSPESSAGRTRPAKIASPVVRHALVRSRLVRRLDRAGRRPATWVSGPPGLGKTTLVASYLTARAARHIWYQIDEGDADIATFFHYLGAAAPHRTRLPHLTPEYRDAPSMFARRFFRQLYARLKPPFVIVFDNYQDVPDDAALHEVMREAVAELPAGGRLIFISRAEPPASFARLRSQQAIVILDPAELRFTFAEAGQLVRRLAPYRLTREAQQALYDSAQGWAAGLILLLEQLRRSSFETRSAEFVVEPRGWPSEVLFDYFAAEIFDKLPLATQEILLQTAFVPDVTASLAEALTGQRAAGQILDQLQRQQYFTNKQGGLEPSYRYHPLFREFLVSRARAFYTPARLSDIRRWSAHLIEQSGQIEVAAALLRDAGDHEGLAGLICRNAPMLLAQGRVQPVENWLMSLPSPAFEQNPWLVYWRGMCRFAWQDVESQRDFQQSFASFRQRRDWAGAFASWSALILSYLADSKTVPMDHWGGLLDELLAEASTFPSEEIEMRVAASMLVVIYLRQPNHPDGASWAERALLLVRRHPDLIFRSITMLSWYLYHYELGNFAKAAVVVDEMRALMRARDISPIVSVNAGTVVGVHELAFALPSYRQTVTDVLELARASGLPQVRVVGLLFAGIQCALSDGDIEMVRSWLSEIQGEIDRAGPGYRGWYYTTVVRLALLEGDLNRAASHQAEMLRLAFEAGWLFDIASALLVSAHVLRLLERKDEARRQIEHALEIAEKMRSPFVEFMVRLGEADLGFSMGRDIEGLQSLRAGMALGRAGGFISSFVWHPRAMARLCARALEAGIEPDYARSLVRKRHLMPESPPVDVAEWPWPIKVFTLGKFEVLVNDRPLTFIRKAQRKPLSLLKAVIAHGARGVREKTLMDVLWPDADGDTARFALTTAVHRLRRLVGSEEAVIRKDRAISLDPRLCWIDLFAVDRLLERAGALLPGLTADDGSEEGLRLLERAIDLYRGPFLDGDIEDLPTTLPDRLRRELLRQLVDAGARFEAAGDRQHAARWYEKAHRLDPCAEDICRRLMKTYYEIGRRSEVSPLYKACRDALKSQLGVAPSAETKALFMQLRS